MIGSLSLAEHVFTAMRERALATEECGNALLVAAGIDPNNPDGWPLDDIIFDDYDESFEFKDVTPGWVPSAEAVEAWRAMGFERCWICYAGGGEKFIRLTRDAEAPA